MPDGQYTPPTRLNSTVALRRVGGVYWELVTDWLANITQHARTLPRSHSAGVALSPAHSVAVVNDSIRFSSVCQWLYSRRPSSPVIIPSIICSNAAEDKLRDRRVGNYESYIDMSSDKVTPTADAGYYVTLR